MDEGPVVVVIRLNQGDDVLAILNGEMEGQLRVEHPHYVRFNPSRDSVAMIPYCALSDEIYYEIPKTTVQFVVPANKTITSTFFKMVNALEHVQQTELVEESHEIDKIEALIKNTTLVDGNDTKH